MSVGHIEGTTALEPCADERYPDCGIRDLLGRLGDRWTVLALAELAPGARRFRELQRALPGISQRMLTLTVRRLERDGMVTRDVRATVPPQVTYELTTRGRSLSRLVRTAVDWSIEHHADIVASRDEYDAVHGTAIRDRGQPATSPQAGAVRR